MATSLTIREPKPSAYEPPELFGLSSKASPMIKILRLLMGNIIVHDKIGGTTSQNFENETRFGEVRSRKPNRYFNYLIDESEQSGVLNQEKFEQIISNSKNMNYKFFETLAAELSHCIYAKKKGRYTESFLYFYRILEFSAISFPLIFVRNEGDFVKSHKFIKSLVQNDRDGDLKIFAQFIPHIAKVGGYEPEKFSLKFDGVDVAYARACHDQLEKQKTGTLIKNVEFQGPDFDYEIIVPFLEMHYLIVTVRNRMFHFRQGEENLSLGEFGGSEVICKMIMNEAIHWFSKIYSEILRTLIKTST